MQTDLIEFLIKPIGVGVKEFVDKLENDPILAILLDNKWIFEQDEVYTKFVNWFFNCFELAWIGNTQQFKKFTNRDLYLKQLLYIFTPSIHKKFYHSTITSATPDEVISTTLSLIGVSKNTKEEIVARIKHKYEVMFVW